MWLASRQSVLHCWIVVVPWQLINIEICDVTSELVHQSLWSA